MPTTSRGYPYESLTDDEPTQTLNGGSAGTASILAQVISDDIDDVEESVQDIQGTVNDLDSIGSAFASNDTAVTGITSTSYAAGGSVVGFAFTAPDTGAIRVDVGGLVRISGTANNTCFLSFEIRAGNVVSSGAVVEAANDDHTVRCRKPQTSGGTTTTEIQGSYFVRVSGLTPGNSYNVRTMHKVSGGTGTVSNRRLTVQRLH